MPRLSVALTVFALTAGCGTDPIAGEDRIRVRVFATDGNRAIELENGVVNLGNDLEIYTVLIRLSTVLLRTDSETLSIPEPINAELLGPTTLFDEVSSATQVEFVRIEVEEPLAGSGVLAGEAVSVFIGGLLDGTPLEVRLAQLDEISVEKLLELKNGRTGFDIRFDLNKWFDDVDFDSIDTSGPVVRIDEDTNSDALQDIADKITDSVKLEREECDECENQDESNE